MSTLNIDISKADSAVTEYVNELSKDTNIPTRIACRTWIEFLLERHGVIADVRALRFGQAHAIWYACLILTKRVREVSRLEKQCRLNTFGRTTEGTIRRLLNGNLRQSISAVMLREMVEPAHESAA